MKLFAAFSLTFLAYAIFFSTHGAPNSDDGFILSLAYRISQGEIPHKDFIYVRPAGSLYLHSIWFALPQGWAYFAARLSY